MAWIRERQGLHAQGGQTSRKQLKCVSICVCQSRFDVRLIKSPFLKDFDQTHIIYFDTHMKTHF